MALLFAFVLEARRTSGSDDRFRVVETFVKKIIGYRSRVDRLPCILSALWAAHQVLPEGHIYHLIVMACWTFEA